MRREKTYRLTASELRKIISKAARNKNTSRQVKNLKGHIKDLRKLTKPVEILLTNITDLAEELGVSVDDDYEKVSGYWDRVSDTLENMLEELEDNFDKDGNML